ncbi:MAG TPA: hypothetical protein PLN52_17295, partial [Opitutaceae bacterium]|nr:hypothetical protein [Opitutaceae bacterium]
LSDANRKLLEAAAQTHLQTGLAIAVHTGANTAAASEQLAILEKVGVMPSAWIWIHAHQVNEPEVLVAFAQRGAWISLDSWNAALAAKNLEALRQLKAADLLHRVLLSHDGNLFPAPGAKARPIDWLLREGRAVLTKAGFTDDEWQQLTTRNPALAYAISVKHVTSASESPRRMKSRF